MRHARPPKQCCWLGPGRYPYCCRVAVTNSNNLTDTYTNGNGNGYSDGYTDGHCNGNGYGYGQCYANGHRYAYN